jgi:predicted ester cyclase
MECFSAFPDLKIEPKLVFSSGQWAGSEWSMTGTFKGELMGIKPTGKSFSIKGGSITEFQGNKVKRNTDYYDGVTFLRQIGVMP